MVQLVSPLSKSDLVLKDGMYVSVNENEHFMFLNGVVRFLSKDDGFYEGAYLNKIKYLPFSEKWPFIFPIWLIGCGYLWEVRKQFKPGASLVELGCAGGVDYFGKRYSMIGLDLSFQSLSQLTGYQIGLQANATSIPLPNASVDGIVSSFFWEHISMEEKKKMLAEFSRVLKPNGKIVFLYDVETQNSLINRLKMADLSKYDLLFKQGDGHIGYNFPDEAERLFNEHGFQLTKHHGMEKTWLQSPSVYHKMSKFQGKIGLAGKVLYRIFSNRYAILINIIIVRIIDETIGRLLPNEKGRIILSVAVKK